MNRKSLSLPKRDKLGSMSDLVLELSKEFPEEAWRPTEVSVTRSLGPNGSVTVKFAATSPTVLNWLRQNRDS